MENAESRERLALVTGVAQNIGRAVALELAATGAAVIGTWVSPESRAKVEALCEEIRSTGGKAAAARLDLADPSGAQSAMQELLNEHGPIDIVVHNAAVRPRTKVLEISIEEWQLVINTNLAGPFFVNQCVIPGMRSKGWGRIIHIGGLDAYWGNPQRVHVVASKLGLVGLVRAQANETARWGITVNVVVPGTIDTIRPHPEWYPETGDGFAERLSLIPMARLGKPGEIAYACAFLASDRAAYITAQELHVTGGASPLVRQPSREYDE
jgi:3-oxoacyl-[acyl-carrier protein] reductase